MLKAFVTDLDLQNLHRSLCEKMCACTCAAAVHANANLEDESMVAEMPTQIHDPVLFACMTKITYLRKEGIYRTQLTTMQLLQLERGAHQKG